MNFTNGESSGVQPPSPIYPRGSGALTTFQSSEEKRVIMQAIQTKYNGYTFRSRTEARWAVFFNTLGIKYEYEKEGFDLDGEWYLPDFFLPHIHEPYNGECGVWFEVKGALPTEAEYRKCCALAKGTGQAVFITNGAPKRGDGPEYGNSRMCSEMIYLASDPLGIITDLPNCSRAGTHVDYHGGFDYHRVDLSTPAEAGHDWGDNRLGVILDGRNVALISHCGDVNLDAAFNAAKSARFDGSDV